MSTLDWIQYTDRLTGRAHPRAATDSAYVDTLNRALREVLEASGLDPDAEFGGFLPLTSRPDDLYLAPNGVDDTAALQEKLDDLVDGQRLLLAGTYIVSATLVHALSNTSIVGPATIRAAAGTSFEYIWLATSLTDIDVVQIKFDANKANRSLVQDARFMGAGFSLCTDCRFDRCTGINTRGYNDVSAVALVASGGLRCDILHPRFLNCGDAGNSPATASDGAFCSSDDSFIVLPNGYRVTDTVAVVESCNRSHIIHPSALECVSIWAITNATSTDKFGCSVTGAVSTAWGKANTGHGLIAALSSGDVCDATVNGFTTYATGVTGNGEGPIFAASEPSSGQILRAKMRGFRLHGSTAQGILVDATDISFDDCEVSGCTDAGAQFSKGTHRWRGGRVVGGTFGLITENAASLEVSAGARIVSPSDHGMFAFDTSTFTVENAGSEITGIEPYGNDVGATLIVKGTTGRQGTPTEAAVVVGADARAYDSFAVATLTAARVIGNASGNIAGKRITFIFTQNGTGGWNLTWSAAYKLSWSNTGNTAGKTTSISFIGDGTFWHQDGAQAPYV